VSASRFAGVRLGSVAHISSVSYVPIPAFAKVLLVLTQVKHPRSILVQFATCATAER